MDSTRFILIRHAESEWNAAGRWQGQGDPELSERGRRQAAQLAESLASIRISRLVCSDLQRAVETAAPIARGHCLEIEKDPSLRELHVGRWTGLRREEIEARDPELLERFESEDPDVLAGGGESRRALRRRVFEVVCALRSPRPDESIVVVTHLGVIRALLPGAEPDHIDIRHTDLAEIRKAMGEREEASGARTGGRGVAL